MRRRAGAEAVRLALISLTLLASLPAEAVRLRTSLDFAQQPPPGPSLEPAQDGETRASNEKSSEEDASSGTSLDADSALVPPELLRDSPARYPETLIEQRVEGEVWLDLVVDPDGTVGEVRVLAGAHPLLDQAALAAAPGLRFKPASVDGLPVAVRIQFLYRFVAPEALSAPSAPATPQGALTGVVRARGTRRPVVGASVACPGGAAATTDEQGRFEIALPAGKHAVRVSAAGFKPGEYEETIAQAQSLEVIYAIEPYLLNPYETVIHAERDRTEVSRVSLREQEVREVPGTMGDPFRVVMLMPGVGSLMSGVAYPIVRGSAPASSGYYLDGIRVPILFHLFLGPAVVHPDFVDGIDFYPGAPPARFGRLMGGVIDGRISSPREAGLHATAYSDLINAGAFVEYPFAQTGTDVTLAGRFSYTAWLAALAASSLQEAPEAGHENPRYVLDFWDYQARIEQKLGPGSLRLFGFGSNDLLGTESEDPTVPVATQGVLFHRVDLRWASPLREGQLEAGATWGMDELEFLSRGLTQMRSRFAVSEDSGSLRLGWRGNLQEGLKLSVGADAERRVAQVVIGRSYLGQDARFSGPKSTGTFTGLYGELVWEPGDGWTVVPGARVDNYHLVPGINHVVAEPRLTVRQQLLEELALKAAAGLYHQQPITLIHVPVADLAGMELGVQQAVQLDVGTEWKLFDGLELNADVYFNPLLRTIELNPFDPDQVSDLGDGSLSAADLEDLQGLLHGKNLSSHGYAYGFELMLRHPMGGNWFGWLSYSLQRSTRWVSYNRFNPDGTLLGRAEGYLPYVFDQTHILNAVLSLKLGGWTLGGALHFNTGRPETGVMTSSTMRESTDAQGRAAWVRAGHEQADRLPSFFRVDVRVARTWAFDSFLLEAYLDVLNVSLSSEVISYTYTGGAWGGGGELEKSPEAVPIVLPVLGIKASY